MFSKQFCLINTIGSDLNHSLHSSPNGNPIIVVRHYLITFWQLIFSQSVLAYWGLECITVVSYCTQDFRNLEIIVMYVRVCVCACVRVCVWVCVCVFIKKYIIVWISYMPF